MLRVLVIGLGSIGRRHLTCLFNVHGIEVAALRTSRATDKWESGVQEFLSFPEALSFKPDGVIVSNPTSLHVDSALPFLEIGIPTLIEKPIADASVKCMAILPFASLIRVAYCMRFHPLNDKIKSILQVERPFKVGFRRSFYLPKWHPYGDYKREYTARKELGGGVARTLSHEVDLMLHWFRTPDRVTGVTDRISDLDIDTDDYAFFTCSYQKGLRVNFDLDFFSPTNINTGELFTNRGKYQWDIRGISFTSYQDSEPSLIEAFDADIIDRMYLDQIKDFISFIQEGKSENATFDESLEVLKIIERLNV